MVSIWAYSIYRWSRLQCDGICCWNNLYETSDLKHRDREKDSQISALCKRTSWMVWVFPHLIRIKENIATKKLVSHEKEILNRNWTWGKCISVVSAYYEQSPSLNRYFNENIYVDYHANVMLLTTENGLENVFRGKSAPWQHVHEIKYHKLT